MNEFYKKIKISEFVKYCEWQLEQVVKIVILNMMEIFTISANAHVMTELQEEL